VWRIASAVVFAKDVSNLARFHETVAEMVVVHQDKDHVVLDEVGFQREDSDLKICLPLSNIDKARLR
jgi:hypothetical protein